MSLSPPTQQEYNDTIQALRSQVELLEQRRSLLQHELEQLKAILPAYHTPTSWLALYTRDVALRRVRVRACADIVCAQCMQRRT